MSNISYSEARVLKSAGKRIDVKVTIKIKPDKSVVVYMRDYTFLTYKSAAHYLRQVMEVELAPTQIPLEVRS